jgi:site-specific DNA-methyltransferase (adenine-specific)
VDSADALPNNHAALLVFTRYNAVLRHTKTRVQYTYCPACGKTTKDYGGKKHVYHQYGTLVADVWRDTPIDVGRDIGPILDRLSDLFGLPPCRTLMELDLRQAADLLPQSPVVSTSAQVLAAGSRPLESRLVNDDCLRVLRDLPDDSIDFCFADPPYNLQKKYDRWNDALESIQYFEWCDQWLHELARVLKPGRTLSVVNIPLFAARHYQYLAPVLSYQAWIAWEALSFPVRMIMPAHYAIVCFSKGRPRPLPGLTPTPRSKREAEALSPLAELFCLRSNCTARRNAQRPTDRADITDLWYDIHRLKHNSRRVDHPCQLPPRLMERLFALFTTEGDTILDCFNGAGTSTLVAQLMARRFIGIELSTDYHQLAQERHESISRGIDPFAKNGETPKAKNSPVARLPKQQYRVSKKALQLEVKRIATSLGRLPSREEVQELACYPVEYYDRYFISWGEVCAAARTTGMSERPSDYRAPQEQLSLSFDPAQQK